jgi:arginase
MGPSALRLARLADGLEALGHKVTDLGNVEAPVAETLRRGDNCREPSRGEPHYVEAIAAACKQAYGKLTAMPAGVFPIALGGDHSISLGTVAGVAHTERTGVLWIDAHSDLNTPESSPSGNVHGMPLAHLLGYGDSRLLDIWGGGAVLRPEDLVFIGVRSLDEGERQLIKQLGLKVYTMKELDGRGLAEVAAEALDYLGTKRLHVSFDADALDPSVAPGVGTPIPGGLTYREAHLLMELLADSNRVTSLDLVEVNPILDVHNQTAQIMVEMASSLLGKAIL